MTVSFGANRPSDKYLNICRQIAANKNRQLKDSATGQNFPASSSPKASPSSGSSAGSVSPAERTDQPTFDEIKAQMPDDPTRYHINDARTAISGLLGAVAGLFIIASTAKEPPKGAAAVATGSASVAAIVIDIEAQTRQKRRLKRNDWEAARLKADKLK